jgi:transcriptional regulator with XRE-family HTH domain
MNFTQMHERLRMELQRRIQRGTLSVSLLARQTGFGQSHLSNFLHGRRQLSLEAMDRILASQQMSAADLLPAQERRLEHREAEESGTVPVVSHATALFEPQVRPAAVQSVLHLPAKMLRATRAHPTGQQRRAWQRFVAVIISAQEAQAMEPLVLPNAVVLIDRHYNSLTAAYRPNRPNLYAVRHEAKLKLRYVDFQLNRLVLRPHSIAFPVELIEVGANETPNDLIVGRVALILNEP